MYANVFSRHHRDRIKYNKSKQSFPFVKRMDTLTTNRQTLIEAINALPDEKLIELASFVEYLQYKSTRQKEVNNHGSSFLMSIAGLGASAETDVSERDEVLTRIRQRAEALPMESESRVQTWKSEGRL
ncbi:DUF2281 domain-containing protein [Nostoc sp.]|uniref:DUF2281 domain-containing protein n=1 Tax=Nostoc sp. TaxID=1180 RepID=UPI002FF47901